MTEDLPVRPRVSVVIPAYNAADFIRETVDSVLAQTIPVQIVVVNDGSTDDTAAVLEGLGDRVTVISQENQGVSVARNRGLAAATGEYVCFLDADDWMTPENLEAKARFLDEHPEHVLVHGLVEVTDERLNPTGELMRGVDGWVGPALMRLIPPAIPCPSNVLTRRALVEQAGGFDPALSTSADFDMWIRLSAQGPVGRLDQRLLRYRRHEGAMFANVDLQLHDMGRIFEKYRGSEGPLGELDWAGLARRFHLTVLKARVRRGEWGAAVRQVFRLMGAVLRR